MNSPEPERDSIIAYARQLGWLQEPGEPPTTWTYDGRTIRVWWSDNHIAVRAELRSGDKLLYTREWYGEHGTVGGWVRDQLRAWQIGAWLTRRRRPDSAAKAIPLEAS